MFFRPSFCCNCGEKIERTEWQLRTSRRFCDLCATDFTLQDHAAKAVILLAAVISIFGIVRFFAGGAQPTLVASKMAERPQNAVIARSVAGSAPMNSPQPATPAANTVEDRIAKTLAAVPPPNPVAKIPVETAEPAFICGAATKKGAPCSRRVKGNVRCWQHAGQPAMLPPEQLRASR